MKKTPLLLTLCFLLSTSLFTAQQSACFVCHTNNFQKPDKNKDGTELLTLKSRVIPKGCTNQHCFHLDCLTDHIMSRKKMVCPVKDCRCKVTLPMRHYSRQKTKNGQATLEWFENYGMIFEWKEPETNKTFQLSRTEDNPSQVFPLSHSQVKKFDEVTPYLSLSYARRMILAAQRNALDTLRVGFEPFKGLKGGKEHVVSTFTSLAENAHSDNKQLLVALKMFTAHLKEEIERPIPKEPQKISDDMISTVQRLSKIGKFGTDKHGNPICAKGKKSTLKQNGEDIYFIYH